MITRVTMPRVHLPATDRDPLGWIATWFLGVPCVVGALWGGYRVARGLIQHPTRPVPDTDIGLFIVWFMTLNLLPPGVIIGWIRIWRIGRSRWRRASSMVLMVALSVAAPLWAFGPSSSLAVDGFIVMLTETLTLVSAYALLQPRGQREPRTAAPPVL